MGSPMAMAPLPGLLDLCLWASSKMAFQMDRSVPLDSLPLTSLPLHSFPSSSLHSITRPASCRVIYLLSLSYVPTVC